MKHDTLEKRGVILTAEDIARNAEKIGVSGLKDIDGRKGAAWQPAATGHDLVEIRGLKIDDREANWMGFWMYLSEERPYNRIWIILCTDRWPEGWQEPQCFTSNIPLDWKGWRYTQWPVEDFVRLGQPDGFASVTWIRIHYTPGAVDPHIAGSAPPPEMAFADLEVGIRRQPDGPRISTEELVEDLLIDLPEGRPAEDALLEHFARRDFPPFKAFSTGRRNPNAVAVADRLVEQNRWRCFDLSPVDGPDPWLYRPGVAGDDNDLWHYLHTNAFLSELCEAYKQTGQVRYLEKGRDLLLEWIRRFPAPEETDGGTGELWGGLSPRSRALTWIGAYHSFLKAGVLDAEQHCTFLRAFWDTAHLLDNYPFVGFNFALFRETGLLLLTVEFPEFASFHELRGKVLRIINEELNLELFPDGFQKELSTGYHTVVARVGEVMARARETGQRLDVPFGEMLERAFEVWMNLTRPDGTSVSVNDAEAHDRNYHDCLKGGAALFGRDDFLHVATCGREGSRPGHDSFMYPYAGYYIMRSGWDRDDLFLLFDGGPTGINHRHEDKLNFDLYACGQRFIVDPGIHTYSPDEFGGFFGSTSAHNTVLVDGLDQKRRDDPANWTVAEPLDNLWHHGRTLDIVQADYNCPYATRGEDPRMHLERLEGLVHTRTVLFARPDYFVILDEITGEGGHTCEALFHFAPIEVDAQPDGSAEAVGTDGAVLHLMPLLKEGLLAEKVVGAMHPVQGWVVTVQGHGKGPVEAPVVIHRKRGTLPQRFVTVLYPVPAERGADPKPECFLLRQDDAGVSFRTKAPGRTDEWHVALRDAYRCERDGLDWEGKALMISRRPDGARKFAAVNAERLVLDGEALVGSFTAFAEW